jgi:hypothetical protein
VAQQNCAYVEEPIDHLLQGLAREVSPIASYVEVAVPSLSIAHPCGEQDKHLELVVSELGGYLGEILQESGATHGDVLVTPPRSTGAPSPAKHTPM